MVRILPSMRESGFGTLARGTKVVLEDGTELKGVTKIVLTAEVNDLWRAEITLSVHAPALNAFATFLPPVPERQPWWRRLLDLLSPGEDPIL